jgi:cystathionine gamma-synthase
MTSTLRPETIAAQAGGHDDAETGAIVPPIHISTTYIRDPDNQYRRGYVYGRPDNPVVRQCEEVISSLEGAQASLVWASGMSAATAAFLALERPAHIVAPNVMYWGLKKWLAEDAPGFGIQATFVDGTSLDAIAAAIRPGETQLVWIETPANPLWGITDIAGAARLAHDAGALLGVDSTVATPVLTQPLALGADVVMHAATKYLNGHSDVVAGALAFARRDGFFERATRVRGMLGAILGPFEASLLLRGMRTLHVRVRHQCATALAVARHFADVPRISEVLYPGLPGHPGHAVAIRQMQGGFGGMLAVRVKAGEAAAVRAAANVKLWKRATSLGGVESLIEHRASIEGPTSPCPPDLLRLSVGLEDAGDLIGDLQQALSANT